MERLAKLILSFVDLAEVEVQALKRGVVRFCFTLLFLIAGGLLALTGVCLLLAAAYVALEDAVGRVWALTIVGALFAGIGGGLLIASRKRGETVKPATAPAAPVVIPEPSPEVAREVAQAKPEAEGDEDAAHIRIAS